jgi:hypothetical protein
MLARVVFFASTHRQPARVKVAEGEVSHSATVMARTVKLWDFCVFGCDWEARTGYSVARLELEVMRGGLVGDAVWRLAIIY